MIVSIWITGVVVVEDEKEDKKITEADDYIMHALVKGEYTDDVLNLSVDVVGEKEEELKSEFKLAVLSMMKEMLDKEVESFYETPSNEETQENEKEVKQ